eukprot:2852095-Rhodomonas_salina.2
MAEEDTLCIYVKNEVCRPPAALHTQHRRVADPVLSNAERSCTCATLTMALFVCAADDGGSGFSKPRGCRARVQGLGSGFSNVTMTNANGSSRACSADEHVGCTGIAQWRCSWRSGTSSF